MVSLVTNFTKEMANRAIDTLNYEDSKDIDGYVLGTTLFEAFNNFESNESIAENIYSQLNAKGKKRLKGLFLLLLFINGSDRAERGEPTWDLRWKMAEEYAYKHMCQAIGRFSLNYFSFGLFTDEACEGFYGRLPVHFIDRVMPIEFKAHDCLYMLDFIRKSYDMQCLKLYFYEGMISLFAEELELPKTHLWGA